MKPHLPVVLRKVVLACAAAVGMTPMMGLHVYAGWSGQDADTFIYTGESTIDLTTSAVTQAYYLIRPGAAASTNNDVSGVVDLLNVGNGVEVKVADGHYSDAQGKNFTTDFIIKELRYAEGDGNNAFSIHANQSASIQKLSGAPADIKIYDAKELILGGESGTAHTVDVISFEAKNGNQNVYTRNLTIADGVSVTATKLENFWGFGTLTVDGTLNITDSAQGLVLSSGENASTESNRIAGSGVINTSTLICGNVGTYNFDIDELNVLGNAVFRGHGVHVHGGTINLAGPTTMNTLVTLYDGAVIQNNAESAIEFGSNFTLDIKNLTAHVQADKSRVYSILSGTGNKDLSTLSLNNVSVSDQCGWDWSFNQNGTIVAEYKGRDISFAGGSLNWNSVAENQSFNIGGEKTSFEAGDNVFFTGDSLVTQSEDIRTTRLVVAEQAMVSVNNSGYAFSADILTIDGILKYQLSAGEGQVQNLKGSGNLLLDNASAELATFTMSGNANDYFGQISVKGNISLHVSNEFLESSSTSQIYISNGAKLVTSHNMRQLIKSPHIKTDESGVVTLVNTDVLYLESNVKIDKNYRIKQDNAKFILNGYWSANKYYSLFEVGAGTSFAADCNLWICSWVDMQIKGGSVLAEEIGLGTVDGYGTYWGKLSMTEGNLTAAAIVISFDSSSTVNITGGDVEFTASNVLRREHGTNASVRIVGTDSQSTVNLHSNTVDWTLNGTGFATTPVIGNVTIDAGNTHGITLANVALTGSIVNNAELTLGEGVRVVSGSTATLSGDKVEIARTISNSGTLNLNTTLVDVSQRNAEKLTVDLENAEIWYSADGSEARATKEGNGFRIVRNGKFYLATGGNVSIAQGAQVQLDNQRYDLFTDETGIAFSATEMTRMWEYYVNIGEITVGGDAATVGTDSAESFVVAQGGTLNLAGGIENHGVNDLLTHISGAGNVALKTNATLEGDIATVASGKLSIGSGVTLTFGNDQNKSASVASFSAVEIDGGAVYYNNDSTTINNLTVKEGGATWTHEDQAAGLVTFAGTTTLEGNISFVDRWNGQYSMQKLTGDGNMTLSRAASDSNDLWTFQIDDASGYTGTLSLTKAQVTLGSSLGAGARISIGEGASVTMNDIGQVTFNASSSLPSSTSAHSGVIYGSSNSTLTLSNNGSVIFRGNTVSALDTSGGAICSIGDLSIRNNDSVLFEKNVEKTGSSYRLRSIYAGGSGGTLSLSAAAGKSIEFRDSVYVGTGTSVNLNQTYGEIEQKGDIIFTGATTVDDLYTVKGDVAGTEEEIRLSRTTEVNTLTNLYGGRLRVEEGAIYQGRGITAHAGSDSTMRVQNAELSHVGYDLTFNAGTSLEVAGNSTIRGNVGLLADSLFKLEQAATLSLHETLQADAAELTVQGAALLAGSSTLNASLTLADGATLDMMSLDAGAVTINGALTFGGKVEMGTNLMAILNEMRGWEESVTLFTGIESLVLPQVVTGGDSDLVWVGNVFSNLTEYQNYYIDFKADVGALLVVHVPEPTTTSLGLAALVVLALRRRRL